jgi:uncharacterized spore protein YtfJ
MKTNYEELLNKVTEFIKTEARTHTIVGDMFELGEFKCIPVIRVGMGFGTGEGEGDADKAHTHGEGGGVLAGVGVQPIGFLVTKGDKIEFIHVKSSRGLTTAFEKVPELIEKFLETRKKEEVAMN